MLCFYSGYFDSACNGSFRESKAKNVSPITEGIEVFRTFIYWMYHRRFYENSTEEVSKTKWETVIRLWVFGDAHAIPMLQNAVIDLLHKKVLADWRVPIAEICLIYDSTPPGSVLRRYVIDIVAKTGYADTVVKPEYEQYWCKDALIDLVRMVWDPTLKTQGKVDVRNWSMCEYHVHEEGVKCGGSSKGVMVAS